MAKDRMQSPRSQEIERLSLLIFENSAPLHWLLAKLLPDIAAKDYKIELKDAITKELTGQSFYVQVKGTERATYRNKKSHLHFPIERKYSQLWTDSTAAVFLVVVDVETKNGYWLYAQEFLRHNAGWKKVKKFTYRLPVEQSLEGIAAFDAAASKAIDEMKILSATAEERIEYEQKRLDLKQAMPSSFAVGSELSDEGAGSALPSQARARASFWDSSLSPRFLVG